MGINDWFVFLDYGRLFPVYVSNSAPSFVTQHNVKILNIYADQTFTTSQKHKYKI